MPATMNYGAAPTYVRIATQTLTGTSSTVTFSNIPQGYTDLVLEVNAISTGTSQPDVYMKVNGSSTTYSRTRMGGNGSSSFTNNITSETFWVLGPMENTAITNMICNLMNYSNSSIFKTMLVRSNDSAIAVQSMTSLWRNTSPITSILLYPEPAKGDFATGSTFSLYGIKAALTPKATGGDIIVQNGQYWYHAFLSSGTFIPTTSLTCDYLVVAGGGGGGYDAGGGGGAGGLRSTVTNTGGGGTLESALSLSAQTYTVTVGAGGAGDISAGGTGSSGSNSVFSTITSTGGGGGGSRSNSAPTIAAGATGGSAGGGSGDGGSAGTRTASPVQGNNGGAGNASYTPGGGGGGAGAVGGATTGETTPGSGGNGIAVSITGSSVTYAGGGGGGRGAGDNGGTGGGGRGGNSVTPTAPGNGTANLGGGGGGGSNVISFTSGASGGSGVVIVRYPI